MWGGVRRCSAVDPPHYTIHVTDQMPSGLADQPAATKPAAKQPSASGAEGVTHRSTGHSTSFYFLTLTLVLSRNFTTFVPLR